METDNIDVESVTWDGTDLATGTGGTSGRIRFGEGSASLPVYSFAADPDTGMYLGGTADLRFSIGGTTRMQLMLMDLELMIL